VVLPAGGGDRCAGLFNGNDHGNGMSDHTAPKKKLARRRRANVPGGRQGSHVVRVTAGEERQLAELAAEQQVSVPRLLIERALAGAGETPTERRAAMSELFAIRRQLAGLTNNVNQLARIANTDGRVPAGTADALQDIRVVVDRIDAAITELGLPVATEQERTLSRSVAAA